MDAVELSLLKAKWDDNLKRMAEVAKWLDYYYNRQETHIIDKITKKYVKIAPDLIKYIATDPLTETITNDISLLFTQPATIKFDKLSELESKLITDALNDAQINKYLLLINRLTNLTFKVGILPRYVDGKLIYDIITGDRCFVTQNPQNAAEATEVFYSTGTSVDSPHTANKICTFTHWTKEYYAKCDINLQNGLFLAGKYDYDKVKNPYGYIPIVWFSSDVEMDSFWIDRGNPVVNANEMYDMDLTNLNLIKDFQAFSLLVTQGLEEGKVIPFSPQYFLNFPGNNSYDGKPTGDAKYITPSPMLLEMWQIMNEQNANTAKRMGLSADSFNRNNTNYTSGYQLRLSKQEAINRNILDRELYRQPAKQLIQVSADTLTHYSNSEYKLPTDIDISIDFGEIQYDSSPLEKAQQRAIDKANGTANPIDWIMEDNPDITTREEAIKLYKARQAEMSTFNITTEMQSAMDNPE